VTDTCKRSSLVNLGIFRWLNQWFFKRKYNNITNKYFENKYAVDNEYSKPFIYWMIHSLFIIHEFLYEGGVAKT
jgi:hypothetical protein